MLMCSWCEMPVEDCSCGAQITINEVNQEYRNAKRLEDRWVRACCNMSVSNDECHKLASEKTKAWEVFFKLKREFENA